ncbi:MAG TPA: glycosyltransferase family 4 protein [Candidatus Binataceae bacterium]|nr:glycosyltransferase family 4 protein [Candidatus Binataceae bacterium]
MKALALIETPGHVSSRYRIEAFAPALRAGGCDLSVEAIPRGPIERMRLFGIVPGFDAVILQRRLLPGYQLKVLRSRSKRLIFDFDDAVFCNDSYSAKGIASRKKERRFANAVAAADAVIAGNDFLKEQAIASGGRRDAVRVIPTCLDPAHYQLANPRERENLELVWIGSSSTLQGIEQKRALFEAIGARFPKLSLKLICDRFPDFERPPLIRKTWSLETEAGDLAASDIGVSWIPDDRWSRGKCGFKILQYYAVGLPVIANRVGVHPMMVKPGITGILADTTDQWIDAIARLDDPEVRQRMGRVAREFVERDFSIAAHADQFVSVIVGR